MADNSVHLINFAAYLKDLTPSIRSDGEAEVLLLTCMDFRFLEAIATDMDRAGFKGKYDQVILAGASLGAVWHKEPPNPCWHKTFFDHLQLARDLHKIKRVFVMEHRDCGAYGPKGFGLLPKDPDQEEERRVHFEQVDKLKAKLPSDLGFAAWLLEVPPIPSKGALTYDQLV